MKLNLKYGNKGGTGTARVDSVWYCGVSLDLLWGGVLPRQYQQNRCRVLHFEVGIFFGARSTAASRENWGGWYAVATPHSSHSTYPTPWSQVKEETCIRLKEKNQHEQEVKNLLQANDGLRLQLQKVKADREKLDMERGMSLDPGYTPWYDNCLVHLLRGNCTMMVEYILVLLAARAVFIAWTFQNVVPLC